MSIDAILKQFELFGVRLGLDSSYELLESLGNPHQRVPIVHVAGSNGKGSVCAYLSAILTEAGYRVGRYTSPHLIAWCERICLNEQPISAAELEEILQQILAAIQKNNLSPTQFEVITAAAWLYFAQQQVELAIVEVGLGGRLDATNVCDRPLVSVITSISREHWQILGSTLAEIAAEKAAILKPNRPAVIGQLPPEALHVVDRRLRDLGCPARFPSAATVVTSEQLTEQLTVVEADGICYPLLLQGTIQLQNSALAIAVVQCLRQQGWQISEAAIAAGMANTRWPGRLQWYSWQGHNILIDGAHNPASAVVLRQFLDSLVNSSKTKIHWVMGLLATKDHADIFAALLRRGDRLYLVPIFDHNSADLNTLKTLALEVCPTLDDCTIYTNETDGLTVATRVARNGDRVVLCGSLYLMGQFLRQQQNAL